MSNVILLREHQDTGRRVVPLTTKAGVQIGLLWTPPRTPQQAHCGERHKAKGYGARWVAAMCAVAVLGVLVIALGGR